MAPAKIVVVIDDEPDIVKVLKELLEVNHYEVTEAYDGESGFEKVKAQLPDLILLDIMMPKMDGYTFLRKLKGDTQLRNIPVIVLTARSKMSELFAIEDVRDYVLKPYEPKALLEKVKKYLG